MNALDARRSGDARTATAGAGPALARLVGRYENAGSRRRRSENEFLPAALEILETPPSPVGITLLLIICAMTVFALAWSWFGHLDIIAVATGKIQPAGQVKVVQPLEGGRILDFSVRNGQSVKAGDVLVELDAREVASDVVAVAAALAVNEAEVILRTSILERLGGTTGEEIVALPSQALVDRVRPHWPSHVPEALRAREELLLRSDLGHLQASLRSLAAQRRQKSAEVERLRSTIVAQENLLATQRTRLAMQEELLKLESTSRAAVITAMEPLQVEQTRLATASGQQAEAEAGVGMIDAEIAKTMAVFVSEQAGRLETAARQVDELSQTKAKAEARLERMRLTSPIDGTVQNLTVTTVGQVVSAGEPLLRIVPLSSVLEVQAYVENKDIGFVAVGQDVVIKVASFPFTRYGTLEGRVVDVARDSIPAPDALRTEGDPTHAPRAPQGFAGPAPTQNLVYAVTVALAEDAIEADGRRIPLAPGMTVTAEIRTGSRRILEYVLSPLMEIRDEALGER